MRLVCMKTKVPTRLHSQIVAFCAYNKLLDDATQGNIPMGDSQEDIHCAKLLLLKELLKKVGRYDSENLKKWSPRMMEYAKKFGIHVPKAARPGE